jgi:membrane protease YdiL (CAAX protease family)
MRVVKQILRDRQFFLALLIAPLLWLIGYYFYAPTPDWRWPLHQPREFALLVMFYPCLEELLFRGMLQGWLLERANFQRHWQGLTLANLATSCIFTALHFLMHPPLAAASVLLPSLVFGYFRDRYGRLHAPILLHVYYNLGYFWLFAS